MPEATPRHSSSRVRHPIRIALAYLKRDLRTEASYRFSFFLQFFGIFFSVAVFYFISKMLGPAAMPYLANYGGDYFSFVIIGLALAEYSGVGVSSFANSLRQAQTAGTLEAMLTTPTSLYTIILSSSLWDYLLTTLRVLVYLLVGLFFMGMRLANPNYLAAVLILLLTIIVFSSLGVIAASFIMVLKRGDPVTWAFSAFSSLLGGVYYPITVLPEWMQAIAKILPITYSLDGMRQALLNGASVRELGIDILALTLFSLLLFPLSLFAFRLAVRRAKVEGSLTHF
jgi:ABC-2 type transport system permease protein